jgi:hypothetical protein
MSLSVAFKSRNFVDMGAPAGLAFRVKQLTWAAMGGPKRAVLEVQAAAGSVDLAALSGLLRSPVEIYGEDGQIAWWGLVWDVSIEEGAVGVKLSLDDLANRVRVVYGESRPEVMGTGRRATTGWVEDIASQADYGVKEGQFELTVASAEQGESYRGELLASGARPVGKAKLSGTVRTGAGITITLECRGWWETLAWKRYSQAAGLVENIASGSPECCSFGTPANGDLAQRIVAAGGGWAAEVVWVSLRRMTYTTGGTVTVSLCGDGAGPQPPVGGIEALPGVTLASAVIDGNTLPVSNPGWVACPLNMPVAINAGGGYWIKVGASGGNAVNYFRALVDPGLGYPAGGLMSWDVGSGAWAALPGADLQFRVAGRMETSEQIRRMAESGQFLTMVNVVASGLYTNPYRNGDRSALAEIEGHLRAGTSGNRRLFGQVTAERAVVVKEQVDGAAPRYKVGRDGVIRLLSGQAVKPGPGVAGEWAETGWGRVWLDEVGWEDAKKGIRVG